VSWLEKLLTIHILDVESINKALYFFLCQDCKISHVIILSPLQWLRSYNLKLPQQDRDRLDWEHG
jgi:hypothetical protein